MTNQTILSFQTMPAKAVNDGLAGQRLGAHIDVVRTSGKTILAERRGFHPSLFSNSV